RLGRQRNMYGHLVAVEVRVESGADERMDFDRLAFHQHRLKSLNAQAVQRWSAVQKHRMVFNHLFKNVPDNWFLLLHHLFGLLNGGAMTRLFQAVIDEWLEQLKRHLLGQAALMQLEFRTNHDHGAARVVHALAQQVLTEA